MGERVSGVAGVGYEEYWTLTGQGCPMCSPAKIKSEEITVTPPIYSASGVSVGDLCAVFTLYHFSKKPSLFDGKNANPQNYESQSL